MSAEASAGRLLVRYGWPVPEIHKARLPATDREGTSSRCMNDPVVQGIALAQLEDADADAALRLVELVELRNHFDASQHARACVRRHSPRE